MLLIKQICLLSKRHGRNGQSQHLSYRSGLSPRLIWCQKLNLVEGFRAENYAYEFAEGFNSVPAKLAVVVIFEVCIG